MTETKIKKVRVKRWMKIVGGLVAALVLFFLLVPVGAKYYIADWLKKNGADNVTIEKLRFNPFTGQITLGETDVQFEGRSLLRDSSVVLDFGLAPIFNHHVRLEKAEFRDFAIDLEQYKDGNWRIGSYTLPVLGETTTPESVEEKASTWTYLTDDAVLKDCTVHLKTPDLDMTFMIEEAELVRLSTQVGSPVGSFTLKGLINESPINLQLDTLQIVPDLKIGGNISIAGFQLKEIARLLRDVMPTLAGEVGVDGKLRFSMGAGKGVQADYNGAVGISGSDIGNGDFATKFDNLSWKGHINYAGPEKSPLKIETDGLLAARGLNLQLPASQLVMKESAIDFSGKTSVTIDKNILVAHDGSLLLEGVELVVPPYGIVEQKLSWQGTAQYDSDNKGQGPLVSTDGLLTLGEFEVGGEEQSAPFALAGTMASWQGAVGFSQQDAGKKSLVKLDGTFVGGDFRTSLTEQQLRFGQEKLELKTKTNLSFGETMDIGGLSSLDLLKFTLFEGENNSPSVSLDRLAIADVEGRGAKSMGVKDLLVEGLKATVAGNFPLDIAVPKIKLSAIGTEDLATFTAGELQVQGPHVTAIHNGKELVRLDGLTVKNISVDAETTVRADNLQLEKFAFLGGQDNPVKKAAVSFVDASLGKISWSKSAGLQGDTLHFDDLVAAVVRDKDGTINISKQLADMQKDARQEETAGSEAKTKKPAPAVAAEDASGDKAAPLKLQKIVVAGKSAVFFEDYTLAVPYITNLAISRLELTGIDSSKLDQKTELLLEGELEKRAPLVVSGQISPFKAKPSLNMKVSLKNYPLSSLSSYTVQSVGTALASGQLQLKSKLALADDKLDMDNNILLKKLETKTISPELAAELNNQLPLPLDSALSILRDSDENISLDIPLKGPVSELNVGVSSVLITALSKAIVPAASGYLMYALGPYGALAYVGMKVGESMLQVELPPVVFAPREASLTEDHGKYLQRIGKILQDRPETDIQICPRVASWEFLTEEDKKAVKGNVIEVDEDKRPELIELGQQRATAVQGLLASEYGIDQGRLLICNTTIVTEKDAVPEVLLQL